MGLASDLAAGILLRPHTLWPVKFKSCLTCRVSVAALLAVFLSACPSAEETGDEDAGATGRADIGSFDTDHDGARNWDTADIDADPGADTREDATPDTLDENSGQDTALALDADPTPDTEPDGDDDATTDVPADAVECSVGADCEDDDPCTVFSCVDRVCVARIRDSDGDGSPDGACGGTDCDDDSELISAGSERPCTNDCGVGGVERCVDAEWTSCSAPPDCDCTPDEERVEDCAMCGSAIRVCEEDGTWGELGGCTGGGICEPDDVMLEDCEGLECGDGMVYGVRASTCGESCAWVAGECLDAPVCCPGDTQLTGCGACGIATRTCDAEGQWDEYGACDEPTCCDGDIEAAGCGRCGNQTRTCSGGAWSGWTGCLEPECCDGDIDTGDCSECGERSRSCGEDGTWDVWGACDEPECCGREIESTDCGDCGTQSRSCIGDTWGPWGACDEPECCDGDSEFRVCNDCGRETRTCSDGSWGDYGTCIGIEGPARGCDPGMLCGIDGWCACEEPPCEIP